MYRYLDVLNVDSVMQLEKKNKLYAFCILHLYITSVYIL